MTDAWEAWAGPQRYDGQLDELWRDIHDALASERSDDDSLGRLAVEAIEPLIDLYWPEAIDAFAAIVARDARLRRAVSCCLFDNAVPDSIQERLARLVHPEDDVDPRP